VGVLLLKKITIEYFDLFSRKNIIQLEKMFSEEVSLHDWDVSCYGKVNVVDSIQSIFNNVDKIVIEPIRIYSEYSTVIAELEIIINGTTSLFVVDVIEYNKDNEIVSIRAYKR